MDEMNIVSKFMRSAISKIVKMVIHKNTGYLVDIQLNECNINVNDGKAHVHLNVDAELEKEELIKILKSFGI